VLDKVGIASGPGILLAVRSDTCARVSSTRELHGVPRHAGSNNLEWKALLSRGLAGVENSTVPLMCTILEKSSRDGSDEDYTADRSLTEGWDVTGALMTGVH
jgi:hypothetical protein